MTCTAAPSETPTVGHRSRRTEVASVRRAKQAMVVELSPCQWLIRDNARRRNARQPQQRHPFGWQRFTPPCEPNVARTT
eukprot:465710-Pyramimonas_sp.AAC.1